MNVMWRELPAITDRGRGNLAHVPLASIPSPGRASWRLGPVPVHAYALCVIAGIIVAVVVASRAYRRSGGRRGVILDVAAWAVPFGLAGAAAHAALVGTKHDFSHILRLWHGVTVGIAVIGVPGAVALGAAGAWIACRRAGVRLGPVAGAAGPAAAFGLAIGGLGNWWIQQFYGRPSSWSWAVQISPTRRMPGYENYATFQPVWAYQSLWDVAVGFGVIWAARRFALAGQRTFLLAVAAYAAGGCGAELLRIGPLTRVFGLRAAVLADAVAFVLAVAGLYFTRPRPRRRKSPARPHPRYPRPDPAVLAEDSSGEVMSA
jgi:prolipoprotein diacylglyceryltransferase